MKKLIDYWGLAIGLVLLSLPLMSLITNIIK
jgi:hypothetical protein